MDSFKKRVLKIVGNIPTSSVASYGQIAALAGLPRAARAGGRILRDYGTDVPWWRVMNNKGYLSINNGIHSKHLQKQLLEKEGISINKDFILDIELYRWRPTPSELLKLLDGDEMFEDYLQRFDI